MKQVTPTQRGGMLTTKEVPAPLLQSTGVVVRTVCSLIGAGWFAQSMLLPHLTRDHRVGLRAVATAGGLTARSVAERAGVTL